MQYYRATTGFYAGEVKSINGNVVELKGEEDPITLPTEFVTNAERIDKGDFITFNITRKGGPVPLDVISGPVFNKSFTKAKPPIESPEDDSK